MAVSHTHGSGIELPDTSKEILALGIAELIHLTKGLALKKTRSQRYPLPIAEAVYGQIPDLPVVIQDAESGVQTDPVSRLESLLVLLEFVCTNRPDVYARIPDDQEFLDLTFKTKRQNGWLAIIGNLDTDPLVRKIGSAWNFHIVDGDDGLSTLYILLNLLARYAFVYGKIEPGDSHGMSHFVEDFAPGVVACYGILSNLELTILLSAMKLGAPAIVDPTFPFPLGRRIQATGISEIVESLTLFPNTHKLTEHPSTTPLPEFADPQYAEEQFEPHRTLGTTANSYFLMEKGEVKTPGEVRVIGEMTDAVRGMGITIQADAEPLDSHDRQYIESTIARKVSLLAGARGRLEEGRLIVDISAESTVTPRQIGELLVAVVRREFPLIDYVSVRVCVDDTLLAKEMAGVKRTREQRRLEIQGTTEESVESFFTCVGCSPFAPDHVCIITPERLPQCGRSFAQIGATARYGYDEMSNIHHRTLHAGHNSYGLFAKGELLDRTAGEWSGANTEVSRLSGGRTTRVQLHALDDAPHTGCSCFRMIMFKTSVPKQGIGIMERRYQGKAADGRSWKDLHYALTGKQTPGMAGATPAYLKSSKFLQAHDGWNNVVWVSPGIAAYMGNDLPGGIEIGTNDS